MLRAEPSWRRMRWGHAAPPGPGFLASLHSVLKYKILTGKDALHKCKPSELLQTRPTLTASARCRSRVASELETPLPRDPLPLPPRVPVIPAANVERRHQDLQFTPWTRTGCRLVSGRFCATLGL